MTYYETPSVIIFCTNFYLFIIPVKLHAKEQISLSDSC